MMMMVMSCRRAVTSGHCCWPCRPSYSCLLPCWPRLSRTPFNEKAVASHVRAMLAGLQAYHTNGVGEEGREGARQGKVFITVWRMITTEAIWLVGWQVPTFGCLRIDSFLFPGSPTSKEDGPIKIVETGGQGGRRREEEGERLLSSLCQWRPPPCLLHPASS